MHLNGGAYAADDRHELRAGLLRMVGYHRHARDEGAIGKRLEFNRHSFPLLKQRLTYLKLDRPEA